GATLFMTLLAGFAVLLQRYSGQRDVVVGSPVAGRRWQELEELIGFFVNTLVLRVRTSGRLRVGELIERVKQVALGGYENQDVPFEKLVEEMEAERDMSRSPLFQVLFVLQNTPKSKWELPGLELQREYLQFRLTKFDLL